MKIQVEDLVAEISEEQSNQEVFDVDFGGVLLQITREEVEVGCYEYSVTNGVDGYGYNVREQYKTSTVKISH